MQVPMILQWTTIGSTINSSSTQTFWQRYTTRGPSLSRCYVGYDFDLSLSVFGWQLDVQCPMPCLYLASLMCAHFLMIS